MSDRHSAEPTRAARSIDDAPLSGFHLRVTAYTTGGMFVDGYILGIVGFGLVGAAAEFGLGSWWIGLLGAGALVGIFLGSLAFGWVTDNVGRRVMYLADLALFIVGSLGQLVVSSEEQLLVLRVVMGIAIGADYAIGCALLGEFVPRRQRGALLGSLNGMWTAGFVSAALVGAIVTSADNSAEHWRWILASSAIPATIVMFLRMGTPESPRWLVSQGRRAEAQAVVAEHWGPEYGIADLEEEATRKARSTRGAYGLLFGPRYRRRTAFGAINWFCRVVPYFALFTFLPQVLTTLRLEGVTGEVVVDLFLMTGAIVGIVIMDRLPRRVFAMASFALLAVAMGVLGLLETVGEPSAASVLICFTIFAGVIGAATNLDFIYPPEIFPTEVRATGVGIAAATSRIGAAAGTFLLPTSIASNGVGPTMLGATGVLLLGLLVTWAWAPETRRTRLGADSDTPAAAPTSPSATAPLAEG